MCQDTCRSEVSRCCYNDSATAAARHVMNDDEARKRSSENFMN
jgi:hypothetical protein